MPPLSTFITSGIVSLAVLTTTTTCSRCAEAHHRALHRGALRIEGRVSTGLRFFHADGRPYGTPPTSSDFDLRAQVVSALRGLGFAERDAQRAVADAETHVGSDATLEHLLRAALEVLTPRAS
jgi:RuvA, C-terminal domain